MALLAEQRMDRILEELSHHESVSVAYLSQVIGVSEATVRRDLTELAQRGKLNKVHGGALPLKETFREEFRGEEPDMEIKRQLHTPEKRRIAQYAASLIRNDDVVFLDAGSTVMHMAEFIRAPRATFVTNSVECLQRLPRLGLRTYVLGGVLKPGTLAIIGGEAMEELKRYNFTKAFLGTNGVSLSQGFTTPDPEEAMVKALAAARSLQTWVLADSSKFDAVTAAVMLPLERAAIVTDRLRDTRYLDHTVVKEV